MQRYGKTRFILIKLKITITLCDRLHQLACTKYIAGNSQFQFSLTLQSFASIVEKIMTEQLCQITANASAATPKMVKLGATTYTRK